MVALVMARVRSKRAQGTKRKLNLPRKVISVLVFFPKCKCMHSVLGVQMLASLIWLLLIDPLSCRLTLPTTKPVRLCFSAELDACCLDLVEERTVHSHNP